MTKLNGLVVFRISNQEFIQAYIHGCNAGMNHTQIARRLNISMELYKKKLVKAKNICKNNIGISLPPLQCEEEIDF